MGAGGGAEPPSPLTLTTDDFNPAWSTYRADENCSHQKWKSARRDANTACWL